MFTLSSFYKSKEWGTLRNKIILERADDNGNVICDICGKPITKRYDIICHHKKELTEANVNDYNISLNEENIMLVHFKCHNMLHERFGCTKSQEVYLVFGAPCSGKSTYISEIATKDDLILDIDRLWEAVSINDKYNKNNRIKKNVFGLRDCLIDQIRTRTGDFKRAYIIGCYPLKSDRERLCNMLGAEEVFIDTDKDTCLSRTDSKEWKNYINDWFDEYTK